MSPYRFRALKACVIALALCVVCLPSRIVAQSGYTETLEVRLMEIDARVVDRDGNPVHGLTDKDFVLREDGKIVEIESVIEFGPPARQRDSDSANGETRLEEAPAPVPRPRTIVFFLDQLPLNSNLRGELFADLKSFADRALRDGDSAAVVGWTLESRVIVPLTTDRARIVDTLDAIAGELDTIPGTMLYDAKRGLTADLVAAGVGGPGGRSPSAGWNFDVEEESHIFAGLCAEEVLAESRRKTAAMKSIVSSLQGDRTAIFVYVSNRMPENTQVYCSNIGTRSRGQSGHPLYSTTALLRELSSTANAAGVTLYSLRPDVPKTHRNATESGLPALGTAGARDSILISNELSSLALLAEATGGLVAYSPKEIETTLSTIVTDLESYYSVAYRTRSDGTDRVRRIRLETKNEAYTVRARTALVDKSNLTRTKDRLVANLYGIADSGEIEVGARLIGETTRRKRRRISVDVRFRSSSLTFVEQDGKAIATYRLLVLSSDGLGTLSKLSEEEKTLVKPKARDDSPVSLRFDLEAKEAGTLTAIGILDENSGLTGFAMIDSRRGD